MAESCCVMNEYGYVHDEVTKLNCIPILRVEEPTEWNTMVVVVEIWILGYAMFMFISMFAELKIYHGQGMLSKCFSCFTVHSWITVIVGGVFYVMYQFSGIWKWDHTEKEYKSVLSDKKMMLDCCFDMYYLVSLMFCHLTVQRLVKELNTLRSVPALVLILCLFWYSSHYRHDLRKECVVIPYR